MSNTIDINARESYFYTKGDWGKNLINVCSKAFTKNTVCTEYFGNMMRYSGKNYFMKVICFFAIVSTTLCTILLVILFSVLFFTLFLFLWLCYNLFAFLFWSIESAYKCCHGIYAICPTCNRRIDMPVYICATCGAEHPNLLPTAKYGIFCRKCKCGHSIPTSIMWGKNKVQAKCPSCNNTRGIQMNFSPTTIAFIGGTSVGKTFLRDTMASILPDFARKKQIAYIVLDEDKPEWRALEQRMRQGILPAKTADNLLGNIQAMKIEIQRPQQSVPERIYLYDPPGESFNSEEKLDAYNYYQNLKTAVFVVDPLSLTGIRTRLQQTIGHMSMVSAVSCFEKWLNSMESSHFEGNLKYLSKKVKCAVVITKVDIPELIQIVQIPIGASSEECKQFLEDYGAKEIVSLIKNYFEEYQFFAVSCSGGVGMGQEFQPQGIEDVWQWILER